MSKKTRSWKDLSKPEQEEAKRLYVEESQSLASIADTFNLPRTTLSYHAQKYWTVEQKMNQAKLFAEFSATKKAHFVNMSDKAMTVIGRALENLATRETPPTPREAKDATQILESLDKITRLDEGKPTEISEEKVMSIEDIRKITDIIPFTPKKKEKEDIEPVEYKELSGDKSEEEDEKVN